MREIVLDTETTGTRARDGDRLIEIGCVELVNRIPTGVEFHRFVNPERDVPEDAYRIHGISTAMLQDKPLFAAVADDLLDFVGADTLVIHNAQFDIGFLNMELERIGRPGLSMDRVVDTLALARRKHPGGQNSLDALCKRYGVDNSDRTRHGAIIDSLLLAQVYVELLGERQATLGLGARSGATAARANGAAAGRALARPAPLPSRLTNAEAEAHARFVESLGPLALWRPYLGLDEPADPVKASR